MKVETKHQLGFFDTDQFFNLHMQALTRHFQDIATKHSRSVGSGPEVLLKEGVVWILNRLEIDFQDYPILGDDIDITTWHRGVKTFKGFREFKVEAKHNLLAKGSSVWIFFDLKKKKIIRAPLDLSQSYQPEDETQFEKQIDDWYPPGKIEPEKETQISLRYSDFDLNLHVNNTIYLGFIETLIHSTIEQGTKVKNIKIRYNKEISNTFAKVNAGWCLKDGLYQFNIFDRKNLFADGEFTLFS